MTWEILTSEEPILSLLLKQAESWHRLKDKNFCANACWYGYAGHAGLKPILEFLVGWSRPDKNHRLSTSKAYDLAYEKIYEALPDCGVNCVCLRLTPYQDAMARPPKDATF